MCLKTSQIWFVQRMCSIHIATQDRSVVAADHLIPVGPLENRIDL